VLAANDLAHAAQENLARGWISLALGLDAAGKPKRPLVRAWSGLKPVQVLGQPWADARGLGLLLGAASGNLAALDVDDNEMGDAVAAIIIRGHVETRMVRTVSQNLHVLFREETPSMSTRRTVRWEGRDIGVEFKAVGTQVAAPPTPGYTLMLDHEPSLVPSLAAAWASISSKLGVDEAPAVGAGSANYPLPWQANVPQGERNKAMYIEAHKLREAGMPEREAVAVLQARFDASYEQGDTGWRELEQTIRSAYRKGVVDSAALASGWVF